MGNVPPHHAGVRLDRNHMLQSDTAVNIDICLVSAFVILLQRLLRGMETVCILHGEFADADQTGARPRLIAVFRLNLIRHDRKLFITRDFRPDQMHDRLLMGHAENHGLVIAVPEPQKLLPDRLIAPGLLPEIGGKHDRHFDLLSVDSVHLLAYDVFDFEDDAFSERKNGVNAGGHGTDISAAHKIFMTDGFRVLGIFLDPAPEHFRHSHIAVSPKMVVFILTY